MLKKTVKGLARPVARPLMGRINQRVDDSVRRVELRLDALELGPARDVEAIKGYMPTVLNVISSQAAAAREAMRREEALREEFYKLRAEMEERMAQAEQRVEFTRREVMFEMRYRMGGGAPAAEQAVQTRVVNEDKLASFADDIRLNLGCGHIPIDGYLNVDAREVPGVDIVADVQNLPFEPGQVSEIFSAHMLEHFPVEQLARTLLPYWHSLLRPGGTFAAVVPDAETMLSEHAAGRFSFDDLRQVTFGEQEYEGDFHFNMFSHASIVELLEKAGFVDVQLRDKARRNGICYEMEVAARKPE